VPERNGGYRAFWSGTVSFGLVSVPVVLLPANRSGGARLRMLAPDGTPLARRYVCPRDERVLDDDDIVRGYEIREGKFVLVTDEELEALEPRKSREIDLRQFVPADAIDPIYVERAYYLAPGNESAKAYSLLASIMERTKRAGIATFVMRGKEYVVALVAERGIIRAVTLRFADELRSARDVGLPARARPPAARLRAFSCAIAAHRGRALDPAELEDTHAERVAELARRKLKRREDVVRVEPGEEPGEEIDLLDALRSALRAPGRAPRPAPGRRAGGRRRARRPTAQTRSTRQRT
jgi:DNA end-binding protein Ku